MAIKTILSLLAFLYLPFSVSAQVSEANISPQIEIIADSIVNSWSQILENEYKSLRDLSVDLYLFIEENDNKEMSLKKALYQSTQNTPTSYGKVELLMRIIVSYNSAGAPYESYKIIDDAIDLAKSLKNSTLVLHLYRAKSDILYKELRIRNHEALTLLLDAQDISKNLNDEAGQVYLLKDIADYHYNMGDEERAIKLYREVLDGGTNLVDNRTIIDSWNAIGLIYRRNTVYDTALNYFNKALEIATLKKENVWINLLNGNIGDTYVYMGMYNEAIPLLERDLKSSIEFKLRKNVSKVSKALGEANMKIGRLEKSQMYLQNAISESKKNLQFEILADSYKLLADKYVYENNLPEALVYYKKSLFVKDSINSTSVNQVNQKVEVDRIYNLREKQQHEAQLERENMAQKIVIEKQAFWNIIIIGIIIFFLFVTVGLYFIIRKRKIVNQKLQHQFEIISQQKKEIEKLNVNLENQVLARTQKLNIINHELKEYAFMNAHNVRGHLATILGLFYLIDNKLCSKEEERYIMEQVSSEAKKMDLVVNKINKKLEQLGG